MDPRAKYEFGSPWITGTKVHSLRLFPIPGLVVVQSLSCVQRFVTPWTAACQAPLSPTISLSFVKCMSIESMMLSNHFILCPPLLLLPSVLPSIRVFSNELAFPIRWPLQLASALVLPVIFRVYFLQD